MLIDSYPTFLLRFGGPINLYLPLQAARSIGFFSLARWPLAKVPPTPSLATSALSHPASKPFYVRNFRKASKCFGVQLKVT